MPEFTFKELDLTEVKRAYQVWKNSGHYYPACPLNKEVVKAIRNTPHEMPCWCKLFMHFDREALLRCFEIKPQRKVWTFNTDLLAYPDPDAVITQHKFYFYSTIDIKGELYIGNVKYLPNTNWVSEFSYNEDDYGVVYTSDVWVIFDREKLLKCGFTKEGFTNA